MLRRLLLPGKGDDLLRRAAERLQHAFTFPSKDYSLALQLVVDCRLTFFQRGGAALWGLEYEGVAGGPLNAVHGFDLHSGPDVELTHDHFLSEIVLGFRGNLISRKTALEYIANKAGGVHLSFGRERQYGVLDHIRSVVLLRQHHSGCGITFEIHGDKYLRPSDIFDIGPDRIDVSLAELLSICRIMTKSQTICNLHAELRSRS